LYPGIIDWELPPASERSGTGYKHWIEEPYDAIAAVSPTQKAKKVSEFQDDEVKELWKNWQCQIPSGTDKNSYHNFSRATKGSYGFGCAALYVKRKEALSQLVTNPGAQDEYGRVIGTATEGKMKITKSQLKQIIKEEIKRVYNEDLEQRTGPAPGRGTEQPPGQKIVQSTHQGAGKYDNDKIKTHCKETYGKEADESTICIMALGGHV